MSLAALGWGARQDVQFASYAAEGLYPGRVVGEHRTHFQVLTELGELSAETTGRLRKLAAQRSDLPGVGDFAAVRPAIGDGPATIEAVLPRTSAMIRQASGERRPQLLAANVDVVFIVTALDGDFNVPRLERYLALVRESGAEPVIVINKIDMCAGVDAMLEQVAEIAPDVAVHALSAHDRAATRVLEIYFSDSRTIALIGSSGVGKSTLTNQLLGHDAQVTQAVRAHDNRGRHTTTHRQLFIRPGGGSIMDTPGMRGLELWQATLASEANFDDVEALAAQCKFRNCRHLSEPACAVRAAVERGELDQAHVDRSRLARR